MTMELGNEAVNEYAALLAGKRVGLVTNFSGLTATFKPTYQVLNELSAGVTKLFTPEHGLHGIAGAGESVESYFDNALNLEVVSLYGSHRAPAGDDFTDIDVLAFDIQDIGVRYYTYIYTLLESMQAAAQANMPVLVFDRPLPLGRQRPVGQAMTHDYFSFVGLLPLPNRYELTIGELAAWIKDHLTPQLQLTVASMRGWDASRNLLDNGLPWVAPSPNLATLDALRLYPGLCLLEGTNVSEGRGTVKPFEQFGAPWIDANQLANCLTETAAQDDHLRFQPVWFEPLASKHTHEICQGVQVHIMDNAFNPLTLGYNVLKAMMTLWPDRFTMDLVSPAIGTKHRFIEYLAGRQLRTIADLDAGIELSGVTDHRFWQESRAYYRY